MDSATLRSFSAIGMLLLVAAAGCDRSPGGPSPIEISGAWGGDHVSLTITETGSRLEFDCAHGNIPGAFAVDTEGTFAAPGTYVREHGGPIRDGEIPDAHPAIYGGMVTGIAMRLIVRLTDTNEVIGTFTLTRGVPGRVFKCL
jgi:hypothetical protein